MSHVQVPLHCRNTDCFYALESLRRRKEKKSKKELILPQLFGRRAVISVHTPPPMLCWVTAVVLPAMKHHSCALLCLRREWNVLSSSSVCNMGNRILDYITWVINIQIICPDVVQQGKESHPKTPCAVTSNTYLSISMLAALLCRCLVIPTDYITVCFILLFKKEKKIQPIFVMCYIS